MRRKRNEHLEPHALARFLVDNDGCSDYIFARYVCRL